MTLYTVTTPDWLLSAQQRDMIASELVRIHTAAMNVPANLVHSFFSTYPRGHAYIAAERSAACSILGVIPAGHTPEEKSCLVQSLWKMFKERTEVSDRDLSIALQELPASKALEKRWDHAGGRAPERLILGARSLVPPKPGAKMRRLFEPNTGAIDRPPGPPVCDAVPGSMVDGTPPDRRELVRLLGRRQVS